MKNSKITRFMSGLCASAVVLGSVGVCAKQICAAETSPSTWAINAYVGESKFGTQNGRTVAV